MISKPVYLNICLSACSLLSNISAGIHYCLISAGLLRLPLYILNAPGGVYKNLRNVWCTRFVRRIISALVRSPLRMSTFRLVNFSIPLPVDSGCIIVTCHTPWKRLLVQWCLKNDFALIIASGKWKQKKNRIQRQGLGFNELREIVRYLQQKGCLIIAADNFNNLKDCPVKFLTHQHNVSLLPARLAVLAEVPLFSVIPVLHKGKIYINYGPQFDPQKMNIDSCSVMQNIVSYMDTEIKNNPSIFSSFKN